MPTEVKGALDLRKALKKFTPDLAKETQKELGALLKPITQKARGFIPGNAPLSGWGKASINGRFPEWDTTAAKRGIGYKTTPSRPNRQGYRALARIVNNSAAGAIYETAGRVNEDGREQAKMRDVFIPSTGERYKTSTGKNYGKSNNPNAGKQFIDAINKYGMIVDANNQVGRGRRSRKMKGRAIFRAWSEDGGKTNAAVLKAIAAAKVKFDAAVGRR
jgi:hypothetical protein